MGIDATVSGIYNSIEKDGFYYFIPRLSPCLIKYNLLGRYDKTKILRVEPSHGGYILQEGTGELYVVDRKKSTIFCYTFSGEFKWDLQAKNGCFIQDAFVYKNNLYLFPLRLEEPVFAIDTESINKECLENIDDVSTFMNEKTARQYIMCGSSVFLITEKGDQLYRFNLEKTKYEQVKIDIEGRMLSISDYSETKILILTSAGKVIIYDAVEDKTVDEKRICDCNINRKADAVRVFGADNRIMVSYQDDIYIIDGELQKKIHAVDGLYDNVGSRFTSASSVFGGIMLWPWKGGYSLLYEYSSQRVYAVYLMDNDTVKVEDEDFGLKEFAEIIGQGDKVLIG